MCKDLQGLSLRNVNIELKNKENNKIIYQDFGEMLFTHFGVSGPTILSGSAHLVRYKNIEELLKNKKIPALMSNAGIFFEFWYIIQKSTKRCWCRRRWRQLPQR